ncbi:DUF5060 domain-containing protein [Aquimarina aggregata]|uniref:DUF5060 domain-containing protein n=1 Tax=Aquimarina aggregata TaxID=1642818 RepID=UPI0024922368|nr:DUF5060 domain-containing protein [Aquimarina aggregata]
MKRSTYIFQYIVFTVLELLILQNILAQDIKEKTHQVKNGIVVVEAEDFYTQTKTEIRKWYIISSDFKTSLQDSDPQSHFNKASGQKYIEILPDTRSNHQEKLKIDQNFTNEPGKMAVIHYKVNFPKPGRYYVWVRAYSTGTEDNGIHVGVDGQWPESGQRMQWCEGKNSWKWDNRQRTIERHCGLPGFIFLDIEKAGVHDIQFSMREDGFEMDQWIMTVDKNYHPEKKREKQNSNGEKLLKIVSEVSPKARIYLAQDFKNKINEFYKDRNWLAINPEKYKYAEAFRVYEGNTANYDVVLLTVGENDGRSVYHLAQNDSVYERFRTPLSNISFEEGLNYTKIYSNVLLKNKDTLGIRAYVKSRDRKEYSRGRWLAIVLVEGGAGKTVLKKVKQKIASSANVKISKELKKWHKITLSFDGPFASEKDNFNPFMHYRFNTTFTHEATGKTYIIPGYFAADGDAGHTSAVSGNKWRVHFSPDEIGEWRYKVDFRKGYWCAISDKKDTGLSGGFMDGATGTFMVTQTDKTGRDFRAKGRLQYVGDRYLKFAETGEYFLKQGPDAPENFLSYIDFDGKFHNDGHKDNLIKTWEAHLKDWKKKDPTWKNGKGKAIIGALNYLASKGLNSVSFLTNNIMGDDQNVFPYTDYNTYDRIDVSKMDQWEILFEHAQKIGLFLHFKLLEVENQGLLDNGGVGANSKLYYRELIARFGHHLALNWNLCEENGEWMERHLSPPQNSEQRLAMAHYFKKNDPYHHHLVIHNGIRYDDLLGPDSGLTGPSIQTHRSDFAEIHKETLYWIHASKKAGFQWAVAVDEPGDAQHALLPDIEDPEHNTARRNALWGTLMAGGWGNEWYFGYAHEQSDISCQDYRSRDLFWSQAVHAIRFFKENRIPFWEMENRNDLVNNPENKNTIYCLAKKNELYVLYLNSVKNATLDLTNADGKFEVQWYDPKHGGKLQTSKIKTVKGGSIITLKKPSNKETRDLAIIIRKIY